MGRAAPSQRPVVLVVEDEGLIRMNATAMVEEAGFEAIAASDADEAIRILESRNDIRAVFTDVHMPGSMDGLRLARVVRKRWPPVALIVTSGQTNVPEADLPTGGRFFRNRTHQSRSRVRFDSSPAEPQVPSEFFELALDVPWLATSSEGCKCKLVSRIPLSTALGEVESAGDLPRRHFPRPRKADISPRSARRWLAI